MLLAKIIFLLISIALFTDAYPDGAGLGACETRLPDHGVQRQFISAPYFISASTTSVRPGQTVMVFLSRTNSSMFIRGFMVEARTPRGVRLGTFLPSDGVRVMGCDPIGSVATHSSAEPRTAVTLHWRPPAEGWIGDVSFQ